MWGVVPVRAGLVSLGAEKGTTKADWAAPVQNLPSLTQDCLLAVGLATCHELNRIEGEVRARLDFYWLTVYLTV